MRGLALALLLAAGGAALGQTGTDPCDPASGPAYNPNDPSCQTRSAQAAQLDEVVSKVANRPGDVDNELAHRALQSIFGPFIWSLFEDPSGKSTTVAVDEATALTHMLGAVNLVALLLGIGILIFVALGASFNTAAEGELLGRQWDSYTTPLKVVSAFALIMPVPGIAGGVLSAIQVFCLYFIIVGSNAGSWLWDFTVDAVMSGADVNVATAQPLTPSETVPALARFFSCARGQYVDGDAKSPLFTVAFDGAGGRAPVYLNDAEGAAEQRFMVPGEGGQGRDTRLDVGVVQEAKLTFRKALVDQLVGELSAGGWRDATGDLGKQAKAVHDAFDEVGSVLTLDALWRGVDWGLGFFWDDVKWQAQEKKALSDDLRATVQGGDAEWWREAQSNVKAAINKGSAKQTQEAKAARKEAVLQARLTLRTIEAALEGEVAKFAPDGEYALRLAGIQERRNRAAQDPDLAAAATEFDRNRLSQPHDGMHLLFARLAVQSVAFADGSALDAGGLPAAVVRQRKGMTGISAGKYCGSVTFDEPDLEPLDPAVDDDWLDSMVHKSRRVARVLLAGTMTAAWRASDGAATEGVSHAYGGGAGNTEVDGSVREQVAKAIDQAASMGGLDADESAAVEAGKARFLAAMDGELAGGAGQKWLDQVAVPGDVNDDRDRALLDLGPLGRWGRHVDNIRHVGPEKALMHPLVGAFFASDGVRMIAAARGHSFGTAKAVRVLMERGRTSGRGQNWQEGWRDAITKGGWMQAGMFYFEMSRPQVLRSEMLAEMLPFSVDSPVFPEGVGERMAIDCEDYESESALLPACIPTLEAVAAVKGSETAARWASNRDPTFSRAYLLAGGWGGGDGPMFGEERSVSAVSGFLDFNEALVGILRWAGNDAGRGTSGDAMFGPLGEPDPLGEGDSAGLISPFLMLSNVGTTMKNVGFSALAVGGVATVVGGALPAPVAGAAGGGILSSILEPVMAVSMSIGLFMLSAGGTLAYLVPLLPLLTWVIMVASYLLSVVEAIAASPLAVVMLAKPEGAGISGTNMKAAMQLLTVVIMQPALMVVGLLASLTLAGVFYSILNILYVPVLKATGTDILATLFLVVMYVWLSFRIVRFAVMVMIKLPNQILEWFATGVGTRFGDDMTDASAGYSQQIDAKVGDLAGNTQRQLIQAGQPRRERQRAT